MPYSGVKAGKIVEVGYRDELIKRTGPNTKVVDLRGAALVPGFVDTRGHIFNRGIQALGAGN